jgi:hypothetical protein
MPVSFHALKPRRATPHGKKRYSGAFDDFGHGVPVRYSGVSHVLMLVSDYQVNDALASFFHADTSALYYRSRKYHRF